MWKLKYPLHCIVIHNNMKLNDVRVSELFYYDIYSWFTTKLSANVAVADEEGDQGGTFQTQVYNAYHFKRNDNTFKNTLT